MYVKRICIIFSLVFFTNFYETSHQSQKDYVKNWYIII